MLTNGLVRLVECHALLKDDPQRLALYDSIAKPNIDWFLASQHPTTSPTGTRCTTWAYSLSAPTGIEDTNHAAYDTEGLWIAYHSHRYNLTPAQLLPFANTYVDIVMATQKDGHFAGRVDGSTGTNHAGGDDFVRDEYLYLAEFRPDAFPAMAHAELTTHHTDTSPPSPPASSGEKNRRLPKNLAPPNSLTPLTLSDPPSTPPLPSPLQFPTPARPFHRRRAPSPSSPPATPPTQTAPSNPSPYPDPH